MEAGTSALLGGITNSAGGGSFWNGFTLALGMGAALRSAKISVFGIRYEPFSVAENVVLGDHRAESRSFFVHERAIERRVEELGERYGLEGVPVIIDFNERKSRSRD